MPFKNKFGDFLDFGSSFSYHCIMKIRKLQNKVCLCWGIHNEYQLSFSWWFWSIFKVGGCIMDNSFSTTVALYLTFVVVDFQKIKKSYYGVW